MRCSYIVCSCSGLSSCLTCCVSWVVCSWNLSVSLTILTICSLIFLIVCCALIVASGWSFCYCSCFLVRCCSNSTILGLFCLFVTFFMNLGVALLIVSVVRSALTWSILICSALELLWLQESLGILISISSWHVYKFFNSYLNFLFIYNKMLFLIKKLRIF